jgi:hypothetical protein
MDSMHRNYSLCPVAIDAYPLITKTSSLCDRFFLPISLALTNIYRNGENKFLTSQSPTSGFREFHMSAIKTAKNWNPEPITSRSLTTTIESRLK